MLKTFLNKIFKFDEFIFLLSKNIKNDFRLIEADYKKVMRVIRSCKCKEHLGVANRLITLFYIKHNNQELLEKLETRYKIIKKTIIK